MTTKQKGSESLELKWGTIKGWSVQSDRCMELLQQYHNLGASMSRIMQHDTPEQKKIVCDLIDAIDGTILNDLQGKTMTKAEAKKYVMEYGQ